MPRRVTTALVRPARSIAITWATVPPSLWVQTIPRCLDETARPLDSFNVGSCRRNSTSALAPSSAEATAGDPANAAMTTSASHTRPRTDLGDVITQQRLEVGRDAPGLHQLVVLPAPGRIRGRAAAHRLEHRVARRVFRGNELQDLDAVVLLT